MEIGSVLLMQIMAYAFELLFPSNLSSSYITGTWVARNPVAKNQKSQDTFFLMVIGVCIISGCFVWLSRSADVDPRGAAVRTSISNI